MISRRWRALAVVPLVAAAAVALTACDALTATGTGTVIVQADRDARLYNSSTGLGSVGRFCVEGASTCDETDPYLYTYYPLGGERHWTVYPGLPVVDPSGATVGLPPGRYALQATDYVTSGGGIVQQFSDTLQIDVYATGQMDLTIWHQSYGRVTADTSCRYGWQPGWAQWPNNGSGGFVCDREIYAYYPDIPVAVPGAPTGGTPWMQSVARPNLEAQCPDGYSPGWAQWPNDGLGGAVCNRTVT